MPRVNHEILRWARETAGLTLEEAAIKLNLSEARGVSAVDRLTALESGEHEPTRPMIVKMAKRYRRPLLTFYMSAPPRMGDRGQDFRTLPDGYSTAADALLDALIRDVQARQSMVRAILVEEEEAESLPFIGSANMSDGVSAVLASIRDALQIDRAELRDQPSPLEAFALIRNRVETAGIFVLLIGNLGSYHTTIDLEIFRGFALADDVAPFVVINDQDAHSAWSFTLLHELVHLWLGQTGVSGARAEKTIERFCNDIAGEFLLSDQELAEFKLDDTSGLETAQIQISEFARERNLSSSMVAYKLYRSGAINQEAWEWLREVFRHRWIDGRIRRRKKARDKKGGPDYFTVRRHRVGNALIEFVGRMVASGMITTSKAGKVLGVKAKNVQVLINAGRLI